MLTTYDHYVTIPLPTGLGDFVSPVLRVMPMRLSPSGSQLTSPHEQRRSGASV